MKKVFYAFLQWSCENEKNDSLQVYEHSTMTRLGAVWGGMLLVVAA